MQVVRSPEVEAVARRIWESFAAGNKPAVANMMSKDPAARWVLTADYEWFSQSDHLAEIMAERGDRIGVERLARVASAAAGGEILTSSASKELLARFDYRFGDERVADLKGIPGTHRLIPLLP